MSEIDANAAAAGAPERSGGNRRLLIAIAAVVAVVGGGAAAWFGGLIGPRGAVEGAPVQAPPIYFDVDSNLIVNFEAGGRVRFLQLGIQVMTRDPAVVEVLKLHHPRVRNDLILLFSEQDQATLSSRDGKAQLAQAALATVQDIVREHVGEPGVEALYFTTFVMQ